LYKKEKNDEKKKKEERVLKYKYIYIEIAKILREA
jgi:hypothetical protein